MRLVKPNLQASFEHQSVHRIAVGMALLIAGLVAIFFGFLGFRASNLHSPQR